MSKAKNPVFPEPSYFFQKDSSSQDRIFLLRGFSFLNDKKEQQEL